MPKVTIRKATGISKAICKNPCARCRDMKKKVTIFINVLLQYIDFIDRGVSVYYMGQYVKDAANFPSEPISIW